jgi:hypothetical protein
MHVLSEKLIQKSATLFTQFQIRFVLLGCCSQAKIFDPITIISPWVHVLCGCTTLQVYSFQGNPCSFPLMQNSCAKKPQEISQLAVVPLRSFDFYSKSDQGGFCLKFVSCKLSCSSDHCVNDPDAAICPHYSMTN